MNPVNQGDKDSTISTGFNWIVQERFGESQTPQKSISDMSELMGI